MHWIPIELFCRRSSPSEMSLRCVVRGGWPDGRRIKYEKSMTFQTTTDVMKTPEEDIHIHLDKYDVYLATRLAMGMQKKKKKILKRRGINLGKKKNKGISATYSRFRFNAALVRHVS